MILRGALAAHCTEHIILIYDTDRAADITSGQDWAGPLVYVTDVTLRRLFQPPNFVTIM
jgi:hypothetical protein